MKVSKLNLWLKHFTNEACSTTFLNRKESARKAGYKANTEDSFRAIGYQNFIKLSDTINTWLDEAGLSEAALKIKLIALMEARETKFIKVKGAVIESELGEGVKNIVTTGLVQYDADGEREFTDGESVLSIETKAIETQRKTLDMALKVKGMHAPTNVNLAGKNGKELVIKISNSDAGVL